MQGYPCRHIRTQGGPFDIVDLINCNLQFNFMASIRNEEDWLKLCEVVEVRKQTQENPIAYCNETTQKIIDMGLEIDLELGKLIAKIISKGMIRGAFGKTWTDFSRITGTLLKDNLPARIKILEGYHDNKNYSPYWRGFGKQPRSKQKTAWNKLYKIKSWEWRRKDCCDLHYMPCDCNRKRRRLSKFKPTPNEILIQEADIQEWDMCNGCFRIYTYGYPSGHVEYTSMTSGWVIPLTTKHVDSDGNLISTSTKDSVVCRECYEKYCNNVES